MLFSLCCAVGTANNHRDNSFYSGVNFRIFIEQQYIGDVNMLAGDEGLYANFPQTLVLLGYKCDYDSVKMQMFSDSPVPDSPFFLKNDTLEVGKEAVFLENNIVYSDGEPYIHIKKLAVLLSCEIKEYMHSLSIHLYPENPFPITIQERINAVRERLSNQRNKIVFSNIDSMQSRIFRLHSVGYSLNDYVSNEASIKFSVLVGATGELFKGGLRAQYTYNENDYLNKHNVSFLWNRSFKHDYLKEIYAFRMNSNLQMYAGRYVTGISVTDRSTEYFNYRDYLFSATDLPDTDFDIFCNGRFMGRVRSGTDGRIELNVSVGDGRNIIKCVRYDIYGREYSTDYKVFMPYQFQPGGRFSYRFSAGYGDLGCGFVMAEASYGITNYLTAGVYAESVFGGGLGKAIVEGNLKWSPRDLFRLEGSYMPGVRGSLSAAFHLERFGLEVVYQRYRKNQHKIPFAPLERGTLSAGYDFNIRSVRSSVSVTVQSYRTDYFSNLYATLRSLFYYRRWSANAYISMTTQYYAGSEALTYGASVSYTPNSKINQEMGYDYYNGYYGGVLRSRSQFVFKEKLFCFADLSYALTRNVFSFSAGISYKLPCMQLQSSFNGGNGYYSMSNSVLGSLQFVEKGAALFSNMISPSGSTLLIKPFLDKNGNGRYDKEEVLRSDIQISTQYSSDIVRTKNGIYLRNLPVDIPFKIVIPAQPMEDITQQMRGGEYSFLFSNYQSDVLFVPIDILSEIYGAVYLVGGAADKTIGEKKAFPGVPLRVYKDGKQVFSLRSDEWGTFNHTELRPGCYELKVNEDFLKRNGYKVLNGNSVKFETGYDGEGAQIADITIKLEKVK